MTAPVHFHNSNRHGFFPRILRFAWKIAVVALCLSPFNSHARVSGPCSDCHTMHNSQDNSIVGSSGPHSSLLRSDCVGCHTGANTQGSSTPYVHNTGTVNYSTSGIDGDTLAGGTFTFVASDDSKGHNVEGITNADLTLSAPPGFDSGRAAADGSMPGGVDGWDGQQITCAGTYGCHGSHSTGDPYQAIRGGHHKNSQGSAITAPGTDPTEGYRLLVGIAGFEDPEWEFTPTEALHNQYKGVDDPGQDLDTSTISYFCSQCHGQYHNPLGNLATSGTSSPWLRHPTDYDMGNTDSDSEYRSYGSGSYLPATPVASYDISRVVESVTFNDDTIVTCISCHRAHGSNYYKAMRWGYAESNDGGLCANCHTTKD